MRITWKAGNKFRSRAFPSTGRGGSIVGKSSPVPAIGAEVLCRESIYRILDSLNDCAHLSLVLECERGIPFTQSVGGCTRHARSERPFIPRRSDVS